MTFSKATPLLIALLAATPASAGPFAVVELFTSEGCSSCPPADQVLADLARSGGPGVYALEFHVDYWNSLGWRDPFSDAAYSRRQRDYAATLGLEQVYTPQMVVNGKSAFVGSNRGRAERDIRAALAAPAGIALTLAARREGPGVRVDYRASGAPEGARLCVAWVEAHASTRVVRGENAGRTLAHANVVRSFVTRPIAAQGALTLPAGPGGAGEVIAFVQDGKSGGILAAARARP